MLLPSVFWLILFNSYSKIPIDDRLSVDVSTLQTIESTILGGFSLQHWPRSILADDNPLLSFLDLLAASVYLLHFFFAWLVACVLWFYYHKKTNEFGNPVPEPWRFLFALGILNVLGVVTQVTWPTAPPWYLEKYGPNADYTVDGSAADLSNADQLLNFDLFQRLYGTSPLVFGSFPSLHAAWPVVITVMAARGYILRTLGIIYSLIVWWAAIYLNHHFFVDVLGGAIFALFSCLVATQIVSALESRMCCYMYSNCCQKHLDTKSLLSEDVEMQLHQMDNDNKCESEDLKLSETLLCEPEDLRLSDSLLYEPQVLSVSETVL